VNSSQTQSSPPADTGSFELRHEKTVALIKRHPSLESLPYWLAAMIVGVSSVLYAHLFDRITSLAHSWSGAHPWIYLACAPILFVLATWVVQRFAPQASGSGIPQVMAALELEPAKASKAVKGLLSLRVAIVKVVSSVLCLLGGGLIGREGPTVQIGATVFRLIGSRFQRLWSTTNLHNWIIAGGASGIAAAFNTPLGGIVFAIEELSNIHFSRLKTALLSAVIVSGLMAQLMSGPYLYFGYPALQRFDMTILYWALIAGLLAGVLGGLYGRLLLEGSRWLRKKSARQRLFFAYFAGVVVAAGGAFVTSSLMCGGSEVVKNLLFQKDIVSSWTLVGGRFVGMVLSYLAGGAGGIFSPSLAVGGVLGAKLAAVAGLPHENLMILMGMAAFLTAVTRAPFTATVLVLEMTDHHSAIFPLMLASLGGQVGARFVDSRSFYHEQSLYYLEKMRELIDAPATTTPETSATTLEQMKPTDTHH
jgi:H+/Cl- antiporter ClcA